MGQNTDSRSQRYHYARFCYKCLHLKLSLILYFFVKCKGCTNLPKKGAFIFQHLLSNLF